MCCKGGYVDVGYGVFGLVCLVEVAEVVML